MGSSEHHSGLAIDFSIKTDHWLTDVEEIWASLPQFEQLYPSLKEYGFILRYPKGKEKITKYPYEPWHIRYVGIDLVQTLANQNKTLEEYYEGIDPNENIDTETTMGNTDC